MTELAVNRAMFWRILRRLLGANRGRLFVMLLALGAGAAVTAALLNLQVDAKRRLTTEFRTFGANVVISPQNLDTHLSLSATPTLPEALLGSLPLQEGGRAVPTAAFLYATVEVTAFPGGGSTSKLGEGRVVLTGTRYTSEGLSQIAPYRVLNPDEGVAIDTQTCDVGERVASRFKLHYGAILQWKVDGKAAEGCLVSEIRSFGGAEDNQVFLPLEGVQRLTGMAHRISLIQLNVPGTPSQIDGYIASLQKQISQAEVRPVRQFTEGEAKIYNRISGLLTATVGIVLLLTDRKSVV